MQLRGQRARPRACCALAGWRVLLRRPAGAAGRGRSSIRTPRTGTSSSASWPSGRIGIPVTFWGKDSAVPRAAVRPLDALARRRAGGPRVGRTASSARWRARLQAARERGRFLLAGAGARGHAPLRASAGARGFYHVALQAGVPLGLVYFDYGAARGRHRRASCILSGDVARRHGGDRRRLRAPARPARPSCAAPIRSSPDHEQRPSRSRPRLPARPAGRASSTRWRPRTAGRSSPTPGHASPAASCEGDGLSRLVEGGALLERGGCNFSHVKGRRCRRRPRSTGPSWPARRSRRWASRWCSTRATRTCRRCT